MIRFSTLLIPYLILAVAGCTETPGQSEGWRFPQWDTPASCPDGWPLPDGRRYDCTQDEAVHAREQAPDGWRCIDRLHAMNGHLDIWTGPAGRAGMGWMFTRPPGWEAAEVIRLTATIGDGAARETVLLKGEDEGFVSFDRDLRDGDWIRFEAYGFKPSNFTEAGLRHDQFAIHVADFNSSLWPTFVLHLPEPLYFDPQTYGAQGEGPEGPLWRPHPRSFKPIDPDGREVWFQIDVQSVLWQGFARYWQPPPDSLAHALRDDRACPGSEPLVHGATAI